jgi:hypothetical protein
MTTIHLMVRPDATPLKWRAFCATHPPFGIALDGYVADAPRFDPTGPRLNLDHHSNVDRLATRATCAQVQMVIRQGLFDRFRDERGPRADVYVNDCDEDVCTSWYLLTHPELAAAGACPPLDRLVSLVDVLDTTAGAYGMSGDSPALRHLAWVFAPYDDFRRSGALDRRQADEHRGIIDEVSSRIERHLLGRGGSSPLDTRYATLGGGPGWALIRETGAHARMKMTTDGIRAYVTVRERPDGRWAYVVGRLSLFIPFEVPDILAALNLAEGATTDRWGGSDLVGGSPRVRGSRLPPSEVERIVNKVCRGAFSRTGTRKVASKRTPAAALS